MTPKPCVAYAKPQEEEEKKVREEETDPNVCGREKYQCFLGEFQTPLKWGNIVGIAVLHLFSLYVLLTHNYLTYWKVVLFQLMLGGVGGFGVTAGAHRLWTHRAYKANNLLKVLLLFCYSIAGQNDLREWVRDHRVHHKFSETDADPHNSNRGFFFAHVGWLCMRKHPEVLRKGKQVDLSDISGDPLLAFHIKHWAWFKTIFCFVLPTVIPHLWWGEPWRTSMMANMVRWTISLNCTWAVNSAAHMWGYKPYDSKINPVENKWVSMLAMGEGWHNYHHTFPWDYRAAELGKMFNLTTNWLDLFAKFGWAYDFKTAPTHLVHKVIDNHGDGTHTD